jgi:hypothetical protein
MRQGNSRDLSAITDPYDLPMIMSVPELASAWGRPTRTLYAMIVDDRLHAIRLGGGKHGQLVVRRADALAAMGLPPERPTTDDEQVAS